MKKRNVLALSLVLAMMLSLAACGNKTTSPSSDPGSGSGAAPGTSEPSSEARMYRYELGGTVDVDKNQPVRICYITNSLADSPYAIDTTNRWKNMVAQENPLNEIYVTDGKADPSVQISLLETAIQDDYDIVVIDPVEGETMSPYIKDAMDRGIKILAITKVPETYDCFSSSDQYECGYFEGQLAAQYALEHFEDGVCQVGITNLPSMQLHNEREQGIMDAIAEFNPKMEVVAVATGGEGPEQGMQAAENMLQAHPELDMFICTNDEGAVGVIEAVNGASNIREDFAIFGIGGVDQILAELQKDETYFKGTVTFMPERLQEYVKISCYLGRGGELDEDHKYFIFHAVPTTSDNVGEILQRLESCDNVNEDYLKFA